MSDFQVKPLNDGTVTITAHDLCLETTQHASAQIHIAGVNIIDLRVVDKVRLKIVTFFSSFKQCVLIILFLASGKDEQ